MKLFPFSLIICLVIFFSETKGNFINDVRDKFGNSDKSYSVKMKSVTKDTKNSESNEKRSKKEKKKGGYRQQQENKKNNPLNFLKLTPLTFEGKGEK